MPDSLADLAPNNSWGDALRAFETGASLLDSAASSFELETYTQTVLNTINIGDSVFKMADVILPRIPAASFDHIGVHLNISERFGATPGFGSQLWNNPNGLRITNMWGGEPWPEYQVIVGDPEPLPDDKKKHDH